MILFTAPCVHFVTLSDYSAVVRLVVPTVLTTIVKTGSLLAVRTSSLTPIGSDGKLVLGSSSMSVVTVHVTEHIVPL